MKNQCTNVTEDRRKLVVEAAQGCKSVLENDSFDSQNDCIKGVQLDLVSCGFGGNATQAESFCKRYPHNSCCITKNRPSVFQSLQFFPDKVSKPQKIKISKDYHYFSDTYANIFSSVSMVFVLVLVVLGSIYGIQLYRANEPRSIYLWHTDIEEISNSN
jgi:glycerol-3-phosphate cytidylyltransferase-like family protein